MGKCEYCSENHDRRGKFCSDSCKQKDYRRRNTTVTDGVTVKLESVTVSVTVGNNKRGKDIKRFEDLHPGIQATINRVSERYEETTEQRQERINRAIHYQHLFPDRYEPKSMAMSGDCLMTASERANYKPASELKPGEFNYVSKPGDRDYNGICTPEWIAERTA